MYYLNFIKKSSILLFLFHVGAIGFAQSEQYKEIRIVKANSDFLFIIDQILDIERKCKYFDEKTSYDINVEYINRNDICIDIISFDNNDRTDRSKKWIGGFEYKNICFFTNKLIPQFEFTKQTFFIPVQQKKQSPLKNSMEEILIIEDDEFSVWRININESHYNIYANKNICFSTKEIKGEFHK